MFDRPANGTRVRYHGTLTDLHGEYLYGGLCECDTTDNPADYSDSCDDDYPNRHMLLFDEPAGPGGKRRVMLHVRRRHFTALTEPPADPKE